MSENLNRTARIFTAKYGGWILCFIALGYFIFESLRSGGNDFANSYFGARFFLDGEFDLSIFDPYMFNKKIYDLGYRNLFLSYNPNPPSTAIFFIPFAFLPLETSKFVFNIVSSTLFIWSAYRLCKYLQVDHRLILICVPVVFLIPIRNQILFGQTYFLVFVLLVEGFIAHEKGKLLLASVLWSTAIFVKVFPGILVLFLILKKDWRQIIYLGGISLMIFIASLALQGIDVWTTYLLKILPRNNQGEIHSAYLTTYQSALMLFKYLFVKEEALNPNPFVDSMMLFKISLILFKCVVLTLCSIIAIHRKDILSFSLIILCGILISPYGSTYSNILLLMLLVALLKENKRNMFWISAAAIFLIGNIPTGLFEPFPVMLRFPRLMLMFGLLIFMFWMSRVRINGGIFLVYLLLLGVPALFQSSNKEDSSTRLLSDATHNLIFDYGIKNGFIYYAYWYDGPEIYVTDIAVAELKADDVEIRNNEIFYNGKQVTSSTDNKVKASILNGRSIIYLSDKGKGIGFYTLRVIPLNHKSNF